MSAAGTNKPEPGIRLAELIAALSLACDLGMGQPLEKVLRSTLIALRLGEVAGCDQYALSDIYYLSLLQFIGCTSHAHEMSIGTGGDEIALRTHAVAVAQGPMTEVLAAFIRHIGEGLPLRQRAALVGAMMVEGPKRFQQLAAIDCEAAVCLAQRMKLSPGVLTGLAQTLESWNGAGGPARLKGEQITLPMRVVTIAGGAEVLERIGGLDACQAAVRKRRGGGYDPGLADTFLKASAEIFAGLPEGPLWEAVLDAGPAPQVLIPESRLDDMAHAFGDFIDLKVPFTTGHSSGVAALAEDALAHAGATDADRISLRRAALMHDLGRVAIPNGIWEKPGTLTTPEWERVRLHPYHGERILAWAASL